MATYLHTRAPRTAAPVARASHAMEAHLRSLDDVELVSQAIRAPGDVEPAAFGVLYERHVRSVFAFAFSKLHDPMHAEDVTAQTFLQALRALPRYQPRGVPIRSWFLAIAANVIRDTYRRAQPLRGCTGMRERGDRDPGGEASLVDPCDAGAEAAIAECEADEALHRLLEALPPAQREVLERRFVAELSIAETARCMARSEGAIKMLQVRALKALRQRARR